MRILIPLTGISVLLLLFIQNNLLSQADFQKLIDKANNGDTIRLAAGIYNAAVSEYAEQECGNCLEAGTTVYGTKGFLIKDKSLTIIGEDKERVLLKTNAGYGLLFINSANSSISNVTIGGGVRDSSGNATNGGIVMKYSAVTISNCIISNDTVRTKKEPIVGVSGIVLREGSNAVIINNIIRNNTWDGIALYRGANAKITDNIIENGRGVGIGITWDANAVVLRNRVSGFWKGIGTFGKSNAVVKNNAIFDNLGWGIVITGNSNMICEFNVITRNGNCGVAPWCDSVESAGGIIANNIITENGWRKEWVCPQVGYWMNANPEHFKFMYNDVWNNSAGNYKDISDLSGTNGNISIDPMFYGKFDFTLTNGSPLLNCGNPNEYNTDGTRCHIGIEGGDFSSQ